MTEDNRKESATATGESPTTVILVRHGQTEGNLQQVWHGAMDAPLTAVGRAQIQAAARGVAALQDRFPVDYFFVSPLPRAQSTAAAIAATIGKEPVVDDELREFGIGDWEGRSFSDLSDNEDLWGRWASDPSFAPPNGESPYSFNQRAVRALEALVAKHKGHTILVVTHGGVIGSLLATLLGQGPGEWQKWDPNNCAISVLQYSETKGWVGILVNDVSHLTPDLLTR